MGKAIKTAQTDDGFKQYMFDSRVLTPNEYDNWIRDPKRKSGVLDSYKKYLKSIDLDQIPF